jgi:hypothetical protein
MTPDGVHGILVFTTTQGPYVTERGHLLSFMVRAWASDAKFTDVIALERVVPLAMIQAAAMDATSPTVRRRKLPGDVTLLLCLAMSLWTEHALEVVLAKMVHGLRLFWSDLDILVASKGAGARAPGCMPHCTRARSFSCGKVSSACPPLGFSL